MNKEIKTLVEQAEKYGTSKIEITRLNTVEKTVDYASFAVSWLAVIGALCICLFLLTGAAVVLLAELTNSFLIAFTILGGFYLLVSLLLFAFRKSFLENPLKNFIFGKVLSHHKEKIKNNDEH